MKNNQYETSKKIREHKKHGDYELVSKMTGYSEHTIKSQVNDERTLQKSVIDAFEKIFKMREELTTQPL